MEKFKILILIKLGLVALILLIFTFPTSAQNNEQVPENNNAVIDTVDDQNDLFDDNTNYKEMYKDLNKDGDWIQMNENDLDADDDGAVNEDNNVTTVKIINVWRPRGFDSDWSPYSDGQWVYTYNGWIWSSSYDWGWAAYHYGRWVYSDIYGWVWMPGRYWAPSWVQWCYTSDYIGWYPLYPRWYGWHRHGHHGRHDRYYHNGHHRNWVIVHRNKFTEKINKKVIIDKNKNSEIINGSKTKALIKYDGNSIINVGPKVTAIEKNTGQKISPKEINYNGSKGVTKVDNNSISIYRNDLTKNEKINSQNGSKTKEVNNGTKTKEVNNGTRTKDVNNGNKNKNSNNGSRNNESTRNKESNTNKGSTPNRESTRNKESNTNKGSTPNRESTRNKESNSNKGSTPNRESTRNKESNNSRGNNSYRESNSNRGNNSSRESNSNRGNNESKGNNNSKTSNRK